MSDSDLFSDSDYEDNFNELPSDKSCTYCSQTLGKPEFLSKPVQFSSALFEKKKPYVYYTLKEILNFTSTVNKTRTIGVYDEKSMQLQYLKDIFYSGAHLKVLLDFRLAKKLPKIGEQIQVFGFLEFKGLERSSACIPVLVVQIWNRIEGNVAEFVQYIRTVQNCLIASENKPVIYVENSYLETTMNIDLYFEEINDSLLNKAADEAEGKAVTEYLNISEELFD